VLIRHLITALFEAKVLNISYLALSATNTPLKGNKYPSLIVISPSMMKHISPLSRRDEDIFVPQ